MSNWPGQSLQVKKWLRKQQLQQNQPPAGGGVGGWVSGQGSRWPHPWSPGVHAWGEERGGIGKKMSLASNRLGFPARLCAVPLRDANYVDDGENSLGVTQSRHLAWIPCSSATPSSVALSKPLTLSSSSLTGTATPTLMAVGVYVTR